MTRHMGSYCKAYPVHRLRQFEGWTEKAGIRHEVRTDDDTTPAGERPIDADDYLYLQEDLVVTDDIFKGEGIVFDGVDEAWRRFCRDALDFSPETETPRARGAEPEHIENTTSGDSRHD